MDDEEDEAIDAADIAMEREERMRDAADAASRAVLAVAIAQANAVEYPQRASAALARARDHARALVAALERV